MKKVDQYFCYVMRESRDGELTYIHSAPCLSINMPMLDSWTRLNEGKGVLNLGGGIWAASSEATLLSTTDKGE